MEQVKSYEQKQNSNQQFCGSSIALITPTPTALKQKILSENRKDFIVRVGDERFELPTLWV